MTNKALIYKAAPNGWPEEGKHVAVEEVPFDSSASPPDGGVTIQVAYLSLDPYMRGRMRSPEKKSYNAPFTIGEPIGTRGIGKILKSATSDFKEGDIVIGGIPIAQYATLPAEAVKGLEKLEPARGIDPAMYLGPLGMPGLTAYGSLYEIGKPKKGETIFISSAAGAVGQLVGQIAKHEGLKVIGSVGSDEKLEFITKELGFDAGFNYKKEKPGDALKRLAPDGIDIYYENVGGEHLEAALDALKNYGRIVACGMISQYNATPETAYPIKNLGVVVGKKLTIQGFIVWDYIGPKYNAEHQKVVSGWIVNGEFKPKIDYTEGIDNGAKALLGIFEGKNFGKAVLKVSDL